MNPALSVVMVPVGDVTRNPKNYRAHPRAQVAEIERSLYEFGQYKPVVLASDGVLLAGHGVVEGALAKGDAEVAAVYMPFPADDPRAEKLLVADNETSRLAEVDQSGLAALLADIQQQSATGLDGTGFDTAGLDRMIGELAAQAPTLDFTPQTGADQSGGGSPWGSLNTSSRERLVWGDIQVAFDADFYERVKAQLDSTFDGGVSYQQSLTAALGAWCETCA